MRLSKVVCLRWDRDNASWLLGIDYEFRSAEMPYQGNVAEEIWIASLPPNNAAQFHGD